MFRTLSELVGDRYQKVLMVVVLKVSKVYRSFKGFQKIVSKIVALLERTVVWSKEMECPKPMNNVVSKMVLSVCLLSLVNGCRNAN